MLLRLLGRFLRPHWPLLIGVIVFQLAQSLLSLWLPTLNADVTDNGIAKGDTGYIMAVGAEMLGVTLVQVACAITAVYFGAKVAMLVGRDLREAIFHRVGEFSEREVSSFGAPSLITRNTNDVQQVQMLVMMTCTLLVSAPILAVGGIVLAMQQDIDLSWLIAVSVPALLVAVSIIIARMVPLFRRMQDRIDRVNRVLREQLTGLRVVRAFVRERVETDRFRVANDQVTETALKAGRLFALMFPIVMLVLNVSSVAVIWFGSFRVQDGTLQVGTLTAFLQYLMQILMGVMMSTMMAVLVPRASVCADRIGEVLGTEPSVRASDTPVTEVETHGTVEFVDVGFSYPGAEHPVLTDITFLAEAGRTTAIIGSTGAGKTTLVNLIPRLFDATSGIVLVDGVDVADLDPEVLWSRIGIVPQRPYLFSGTVASNLRYGNPDATDDELWHALEVAQARDFVEAMPEGLDAPIAQGGTNVSGGQRQRLAIARALVRKPEIFVFDDSFSALDTATDARLRAALARDVTDATMIVVAQRVSTIVDADQIIVLDDGRVVGRGTHDELLESNETYAEIVSSQLAAQDAA
ncbi:ATP-binding cassette, subfamily B [Leifsonia sp. 98AMF]|uniref:ABC transporter ATP-binding protein n=1 Tax=unclassified Leifsonia TaxID=2663824 RepID=UPI00087C8843|nr:MULTISPECIES: ABC transporter ATP-binding protein [unclassified Leifsonia]SDH24724.1 ATP-binding cassette, subfamily B [Leifsonia sp. 197AMF]SDJ13665.1 ATP-binding cassette, subfamily B [Leifsonia sp. 466MF]SDJ55129.1 ATP-binding cassette, subfamily B [Leifsonia sp. 157MF]SDN35299.1 ATP-binding cassette, subfamily B [Leifsonia sp. 509MF]SEM86538.1 ATP-binding cassette, subfamily B [Leifsonia sp. 467MF]